MDLGASTFLFFNSFNNTWHKPVVEAGGAVVRATLRCQVSVRNYAYRFSMPDETVETRHPWLDFSLPRRPCLGISVLYSIILQTLNSCAIRPPYSTACLHHRLTPLTLRYNVLVLTCGSDGTALSAFMWEAQNLNCFPLTHTKFAAGHAVCSEGNYELPRDSIFPNNKKSPGISSIYPYMGSGLPS